MGPDEGSEVADVADEDERKNMRQITLTEESARQTGRIGFLLWTE